MITKEEIESLYAVFSLRLTAKQLNLSYSGLQYWIYLYGIKKRSKSEAQTGQRNHAFGKNGKQSKRFGKSHSIEMKTKFSNKRIGPSNPHWKGGITTLTNRIRQIVEYKLWKKNCLERDKRLCQICNSSNFLEVDHIQSLSDLLCQNQIDSVEKAKLCEKLWSVSNGQTLCHSCHRKKHFKT